MKSRSLVWLTGASLLALVLLAGCPMEPPVTLFAVSGAIERPEGTGNTAYIKLVAQGAAYTAPALFSTSVAIAADTANYSIQDVEAGTYSVYAFVDMDGSAAGDPNPLPGEGDWAYGGPAVTITVSSDLSYQISAGHPSWTLFVTYGVSGTVSNSGAADGAFAYVKLVPEGTGDDAEAVYLDQSDAFSGGAAWYSMTGVATGSYGIYVFIDADGDAGVPIPTTMPEPGEWSYGGTLTVSGATTFDVGLSADWRRYAMWKVTGTLTQADAANGDLAYVKLVAAMGESNAEAISYDLSGAFSGGSASYSLWVASGSYTLYAFIDGDADVGTPTATTMPELGEWAAGNKDFTTFLVDSDATRDLVDSGEWSKYRLGTVLGTLWHGTSGVGTFAYVKLVASGDGPGGTALYSTSCQFDDVDHTADFLMPEVEFGVYRLYAFIDLDGNAATSSYLPTNGDLMPTACVYEIDHGTAEFRQDCSAWTAVYNMSGMLYKDGLAEDEIAYVKLVEAGATYQATALYSTSTTVVMAGSGNYSFALLPAGDYSVHAFIDVDGDAGTTDYLPDTGDHWQSKDFTLGDASTTLDFLDLDWDTFL